MKQSSAIACKHSGTHRRNFLTLLGAGGVTLLTSHLFPNRSFATAEDAQKSIDAITGGRPPVVGKVKIDLPQIAENGNTVPFAVNVESPMTEEDGYVKAIHVLAKENPQPEVASFYLSPQSGKAEVGSRMRLAKTQYVVAVAQMSNGEMYIDQQPVKVTIGGCGG